MTIKCLTVGTVLDNLYLVFKAWSGYSLVFEPCGFIATR